MPLIGGGIALVVAAVGVAVWATRPGVPPPPATAAAPGPNVAPVAAPAPGAASGEAEAKPAEGGQLSLRRSPASLAPGQVNAAVVRFDFFEKARNPSGKGVVHRYRQEALGDALVVIDDATGLMWQKAGSDTAIDRDGAQGYVDRLNREKFGGFGDWRVPTAVEAMSLMQPEPQDKDNKIHIAPIFARGVNFVWTADSTADGKRGWIVYFYDAEIVQERPEFNAWVRAVRWIGKP